MGFKFSHVCDLLSRLEDNRCLKAASFARSQNPDFPTVKGWFNQHQKRIHGGETDRLALLSCLFPEKRPDRVFGLREPSLVKIVARCLLLGASRRRELDQWKASGGVDLGQCVENVMRQAENDISGENAVTVEDIDMALNHIASRCRFSCPELRRNRSAVAVDNALAPIFRRLSSRDAKWFTRMILRDYSPVEVPAKLVIRNFHFLLPQLLLFQDSLEAALETLNTDPIKSFPPRADPQYAKLLGKLAITHLNPRVGTKIGRPEFDKGRSIKHCCKMVGKRTMSIEKKYDGEYCQIHIDLSKGRDYIKIFSKRGKDATADRRGIHDALRECLRIGKADCKFSSRCILEGELLVWDDAKPGIQGFHKLRRHLPRSGSFIGTENDSPPTAYEHLFMVFFDILLIDDNVCLSKTYRERRNLLTDLIIPIEGRTAFAEQEYVNFALPNSHNVLRDSFAMATAQRWEGLILKGSEDPYFSILQQDPDGYAGRWIKLKKDYIPGLGDTADFAIIGARYDPQDASNLKEEIRPLLYTTFFVGCIEESRPSGIRPVFRVVDALNRNNMSVQHMKTLNSLGQFQSREYDAETSPFEIRTDQLQLPRLEVIFKSPFVVEMYGAGFERPPSVTYYTLRFPRVLKIHVDQGLEDATSFGALQELAKEALLVPEDGLSQEATHWAQRLDAANGKPEYLVEASDESFVSEKKDDSSLSTSHEGPGSESAGVEHDKPSVKHPPAPALSHHTKTSPITPSAQGKLNETSALRESHNRGSQRRSLSQKSQSSPAIPILPDNTQTVSRTENGPPQREGWSRHLSDLTNLSASRSSRRCSIISISSDEETIPTSPLSPSGGACSAGLNKPLAKPLVSHSPDAPKAASQNRVNKADTPTNSNSGPKAPSTLKPADQAHIPTGFHLLENNPILLPRHSEPWTRFDNSLSHKLTRSLCSTIPQFLDKLTASPPHNDLNHPSTTKSPAGIVLVDANPSNAPHTASLIAQIGNTLAKLQRSGTLSAATGRVIFLDAKLLSSSSADVEREKKSTVNTREYWESMGQSLFVGCLIWGYGTSRTRTRTRGRKRRKLCDNDDVGRDRAVLGNAGGGVVTDVTVSWEWRDVFCLC
ncbi:hypothetical protein AJ80_08070 [Polytolypa hystricis UAMH7299]|uniref:ATP-dependent DNA ligase family profile domain-containing protein n=1 Tax=Polytolypa hystricis (strain UAMH7299) TaxID=1447883 RepID=A0A2B7XEH0_POLH7|nr:hypothetical protein AJ80_08070 [Polytolypa hystricis UAMH7299]